MEPFIVTHGLKPREGRKWVFLAEKREDALRYARAWTAAAIDAHLKRGVTPPEPVGIIVSTRKPAGLVVDNYNLASEPGQWKAPRVRPGLLTGIERVEFPELRDEKVVLRWVCFWIGVVQDDDEDDDEEVEDDVPDLSPSPEITRAAEQLSKERPVP